MNKYAYLGISKKFHHSDLVVQIVKLTNCKRYLELGVYKGKTFNKVVPLVESAVGVDAIYCELKTGEFICGTTDFFFKTYKGLPFDVIFIDSDHSFESAKKDFDKSVKILNKHGIIIVHDTDPISKEYTASGYCGDSHLLVDYIEEQADFDIVTLPICEAGISIIKRKRDRRVLEFS